MDVSKLNAFLGRALADMGAAMNAPLVMIGDKLGLYKAMADTFGLTEINLRVLQASAGIALIPIAAGMAMPPCEILSERGTPN